MKKLTVLLTIVIGSTQILFGCRLWGVIVNDGYTLATCQNPETHFGGWFTYRQLEGLQDQGGSEDIYPYNNDDGWSLMYYESGVIDEENHLWRSNQEAYDNYDFTVAQHSLIDGEGTIAMGHVRMSTSEFTENYPNPHPFIYPFSVGWSDKQFSFIHNGSVDKDRLRTFLTDGWLNDHQPNTHNEEDWNGDGWDDIVDSELYFFWIMKNIEEVDGDILLGLYRALHALENDYVTNEQNKNFIFSDGVDLYAYRSTGDDTHPLKYCTGENEIPEHPQNHKAVMSTVPGGFPINAQEWVEMNNKELVFLPADGDVVVFPFFCWNTVKLANRHNGEPESNLGGTLNLYFTENGRLDMLNIESDTQAPVSASHEYSVRTNHYELQGERHLKWNDEVQDNFLTKSNFFIDEYINGKIDAYFDFQNEVTVESSYPVNLQLLDLWFVRNTGSGVTEDWIQTGEDWVDVVDGYDVFQNQNPQFQPNKPIYSIKAPEYYEDTDGIWEFNEWTSNGLVDFGGGNSSTTNRETDVVFLDADAEVEAQYDLLTANGNLVENTAGWNIVGLPRVVEDSYHYSLYPNSYEGWCLRYENGGYNYTPNLTPSEGYWLRFNESGENVIIGEEITELPIDLTEGWQLISGISEPVPIYYILDPNHIIIRGTIMDKDYDVVGELIPGIGYWVRASQPGTITITNTPFTPNQFTDRMDDANYVKFTNNTGKEKKVYFGVEVPEEEQLSYTLPPLPPDEVMATNFLDARYSDQKKYTETSGNIELRNTDYPLTVEYGILNDDEEWEISSNAPKRRNGDEEYGDIRRVKLNRTGTIVFEHPIESFTIRKTSTNNLPTEFALKQNYPNPFNPETVIRYQLPVISDVQLTVYDLRGREVLELVNSRTLAGTHHIIWNGTDAHGQPVASGMYLYQLKTNGFVETKKLVLMK